MRAILGPPALRVTTGYGEVLREVNANFVSLIASAQLHALEPWAYLRDLLCLLPGWPQKRVLELAPAYWSNTVGLPRAQSALAANIYRRAILSTPA